MQLNNAQRLAVIKLNECLELIAGCRYDIADYVKHFSGQDRIDTLNAEIDAAHAEIDSMPFHVSMQVRVTISNLAGEVVDEMHWSSTRLDYIADCTARYCSAYPLQCEAIASGRYLIRSELVEVFENVPKR